MGSLQRMKLGAPFCLLSVLLFSACLALAQSEGRLQGVVLDPAGALVPGHAGPQRPDRSRHPHGRLLSLFKNFPITERVKLEFRAEACNIANHPQFGQPNGDITNTSPTTGFGTITSTLLDSERQIQFAARVVF